MFRPFDFPDFTGGGEQQLAFNRLIAVGDWILTPVPNAGIGGYTDTAMTIPVSNANDTIRAIKGGGVSKPSVSNLIDTGAASTNPTWYARTYGYKPTYGVQGIWDRFIRFINGTLSGQSMETNPGATSFSLPIDVIILLRPWSQTDFEQIG